MALHEFKDQIPFPLYCTRLWSGRFEFVNKAFTEFLGKDEEYFQSRNAGVIYTRETNRDDWIREVEANRDGITVFSTELYTAARKCGAWRADCAALGL